MADTSNVPDPTEGNPDEDHRELQLQQLLASLESDPSASRADYGEDSIRCWVESLLEVRRSVRSGRPVNRLQAFILAGHVARELPTLLTPLADCLNVKVRLHDFDDLPVEQVRANIAHALERGFPLPQEVAKRLAHAVLMLNAGCVGELLQKTPGRRGVSPQVIGLTKLQLLMWIRYQYGLGRKVSEAQAEVASKIGRTHEAIAKWPRDVSEIYGEDRVNSLLASAEKIGSNESDNSRFTQDDIPALIETRELLDTELAELAEDFKAAVMERKAAD